MIMYKCVATHIANMLQRLRTVYKGHLPTYSVYVEFSFYV